ncbi:hypothetical protein NC652_029673 [Populus alba x Populus x berolinensis]|nr:hypothetical protein NC652_029673 [Populus alba x Populus x berolinensis]
MIPVNHRVVKKHEKQGQGSKGEGTEDYNVRATRVAIKVFSSLIFALLLQDLFGRKVLIVHYLLSSNSIARNKNTTI